ncbi:MAG: fibronectin type III domain-containing protein, partial [Flavobacteriales bacterium]
MVDNTFSASLSSELATLVSDLRMDGWAVLRTDLPRTASVATVKSTILGHYNADPANTKAVFIVGHLAVPYSGNQAPDGHSEHSGAWPSDGYYGELNGSWTDNSVNNPNTQRAANANVPGDGKFDQSDFPSPLELQVGRVDFFDMPAFSLNETELTRNYLNKLHNYKIKQWAPQQRGLVYDNLQWVSNPLAASAWRSIPALVSHAQTTAAAHLASEYPPLVHNQSYLWTYFSGGGQQATVNGVLTYNGAARCGTTETWASSVSSGGVFNMSLGSYFGDWDNKNNFLRAPLATGQVLTNCWAGLPSWNFHHMGMGANIGYSTLVSMNNTGLYAPVNDGWQPTLGRVHMGLMGDPSLRQKMISPPSGLSVSNSGGYASLTWGPSSEPVDGYHIYTIDGSTGAITRITTSPVTGTSHVSTTAPYVPGREYMVRAVKLTVEPCGSFHNLSLGVSVVASGSATDCNGTAGGSALPGTPCNDGNPCTVNDAWNASCQCVGTLVQLTATITAGGPTTFCAGGSVVLSANTGTGLTYQWRRNGAKISGATA